MAAAPGNQNAKGNTGGKSLNDRKLAAEVRSIALTEIKAILQQEKLTEMKKQIILRLAPSLLPRLNEHTGEDGDAIQHTVTGFNYLTPNDPNNQANSEATPSVAEVA